MKPRRRKCKTCREWFYPKFANEPCCEHEECRKEYKVNEQMKKAKKALVVIRKENKSKARKERDESKEARKQAKIEQAREKKDFQDRKKGLIKITVWQKKLRDLVQQWVLHVRDKGAKCCTCPNPVGTEAGHYLSVGSRIELQFEPTNIHPQCHECNVYKSGNKAEYDKFILAKYGQDHFDWLNGPQPELRVKYPTWREYEAEIKRYRKLLRDAGLTPRH